AVLSVIPPPAVSDAVPAVTVAPPPMAPTAFSVTVPAPALMALPTVMLPLHTVLSETAPPAVVMPQVPPTVSPPALFVYDSEPVPVRLAARLPTLVAA